MILHSKPLRLQRYYKKMTYANLYAIFCKFITLTNFERSGLSTLSSFAAVYSIRMAIFFIFVRDEIPYFRKQSC